MSGAKWVKVVEVNGMLIGKYTNALDPKGRVFVPAAFRGDLGDRFVLTTGLEGKSLYIYPMDEWEKFVGKIQQLPPSNKSRSLMRHFCSNANNCDMDSQGRILIPQELRDKAALQKEVVFIGTVDKIEIWNPENAKANEVENIEELLESLDISF